MLCFTFKAWGISVDFVPHSVSFIGISTKRHFVCAIPRFHKGATYSSFIKTDFTSPKSLILLRNLLFPDYGKSFLQDRIYQLEKIPIYCET